MYLVFGTFDKACNAMTRRRPAKFSQHNKPVTVRDRNPTLKTFPYEEERAVIFIDGDCLLCNRFVDVLVRLDPNNRVLISTLQGKTAQRYLPPLPPARETWSILYWDKHGFYTQSEAFVKLSYRLGGWLSALGGIVQVIPTPIRDAIYRFVGRNRYRWFGRRSTCRFLTEEDKARFLP